jgi:hypothetical protein
MWGEIKNVEDLVHIYSRGLLQLYVQGDTLCAWMFGHPIPCKNEHCSKNLTGIWFVGAISCSKCSCQVVLHGHPWPKNVNSLRNIKIDGEGGGTSASRTLLWIPKVPSNMWSCPWPKFPTSNTIALWHELEAQNVNWKNPNVGVCLCQPRIEDRMVSSSFGNNLGFYQQLKKFPSKGSLTYYSTSNYIKELSSFKYYKSCQKPSTLLHYFSS